MAVWARKWKMVPSWKRLRLVGCGGLGSISGRRLHLRQIMSDRREIVVFELLQACPQFCEVQIRLLMRSEFVNMREQQISMVISIFVCVLENGIKFE